VTITRSDPNRAIIDLLEREKRLAQRSKLDSYYPDVGDLRRELYPKHLESFRAGADRRERAFIAANRIGKSEGVGGYETTLHLTGLYPSWWAGRRFSHPITAWAAGDSAKTTRDILQRILLGPVGEFGTGLIPADCLLRTTVKPGVSDCIETVFVKHVSGGTSELTLKSYDQGREAFQGTNRHLIWLDEETDRSVYVECLLRTMTTNGLLLLTFTPLLGMTDICRDFLQPQDADSSKFCVQATWDDCPHLSDAAKAELLASIPPYQRQARSKGVPQLGSGAIYQVPEEDITVADFAIPEYWPRAYGMDVGWNRTAAVWGARNNETGEIFLYSEHYQGLKEPSLHAEAISSRGKWIYGVIDPAARGRSQVDGTQLIEAYRECGLDLEPALNAVESGIYAVWQLMSAGKLKVFRSLGNWLQEFRLYQRDSDGRIVKQNDHLMDATRYLILSGRDRMRTKPDKPEKQLVYNYFPKQPGVDELMSKLIEFPSKKVLDYISIHGHPSRPGWFVRHHYVDGTEKDHEFFFEDAEEMIRHLRSLTTDRLERGE
jgi:phage terminase large subunit-like protein